MAYIHKTKEKKYYYELCVLYVEINNCYDYMYSVIIGAK